MKDDLKGNKGWLAGCFILCGLCIGIGYKLTQWVEINKMQEIYDAGFASGFTATSALVVELCNKGTPFVLQDKEYICAPVMERGL